MAKAVSLSSCVGTAQALSDLFGQRLCVKENRREGQSPALRTKKILFFAGVHNVSSVTAFAQSLKHFLKRFRGNRV